MSAGQTKSEAALVVQQRGVLAPVFRTSGCKRRKASTEDCGYVSVRAPSRDRARVTDRPAKEGGFSVALGGGAELKAGLPVRPLPGNGCCRQQSRRVADHTFLSSIAPHAT